jgi:hypothetical protein
MYDRVWYGALRFALEEQIKQLKEDLMSAWITKQESLERQGQNRALVSSERQLQEKVQCSDIN